MPLVPRQIEPLRSQQFAVFTEKVSDILCCHVEAEPTEANDSEYAWGLPVQYSETPTFQREGEHSFSDHTETDAAHPEDKTVEISCAIL